MDDASSAQRLQCAYGGRNTVKDLQTVLGGVVLATRVPEDLAQFIFNEIAETDTKRQLALWPSLWARTIVNNPPGIYEESLQVLRLVLAVSKLRLYSRNSLVASRDTLDIVWKLIFDALTSPHSQRLTFTVTQSAQRFFAVPLCSIVTEGSVSELFCFHVWLPNNERRSDDFAIHAHQTSTQSWVLAGQSTHHRYNVEAVNDIDEATHSKYVPRSDDSKQATPANQAHQQEAMMLNTGKLKKVTRLSSVEHDKDMSYAIPSGDYHSREVDPESSHATLVFFNADRGIPQDAEILGPIDGKECTQIPDSAGTTAKALAQFTNALRSMSRDESD